MGFGLREYNVNSHVFHRVMLLQAVGGSVGMGLWYLIAKRYHFIKNQNIFKASLPIAFVASAFYSGGVFRHVLAAIDNVNTNASIRRERYLEYESKNNILSKL